MADRRRLQKELDQCLKKIDEGIDGFQKTLAKYHSTGNASQRDKLGEDLKKEIKKLQRLRDNIKQWQSGNDIKDKDILAEARLKIEDQMEIFKNVEKENKGKLDSSAMVNNYSHILDPSEKLRLQTRDKIKNFTEVLDTKISSNKTTILSIKTGKFNNENGDDDNLSDSESGKKSSKKSSIISRKDKRKNKKNKKDKSADNSKNGKDGDSSSLGKNGVGSVLNVNEKDFVPLEDLDPELQTKLFNLEDLDEVYTMHLQNLQALLRMLDNGSREAEELQGGFLEKIESLTLLEWW